jgi:hypothetical protein
MSARSTPVDRRATLARRRVGPGALVALGTAIATAVGAGYVAGQGGLGLLALGLLAVSGGLAVVVTRALAQEPAQRVLRLAGMDVFRRELDRSRRHRRSFALISLPFQETPTLWESDDPNGDGIAVTTLRLLGTALRITDAAWIQGDEILVLLPESDRATAEAFLARARAAAPDRFGDRAGIALFPDDGITSGALLDAARLGMRGEAIPQPLAPTKIEPVIDEREGSLPAVGTETG